MSSETHQGPAVSFIEKVEEVAANRCHMWRRRRFDLGPAGRCEHHDAAAAVQYVRAPCDEPSALHPDDLV